MDRLPVVEVKVTDLVYFEIAVKALKEIFIQGHDYELHPEFHEPLEGQNTCDCCIAEKALTEISKGLPNVLDSIKELKN